MIPFPVALTQIPTVLVVDDEPHSREILASLLVPDGYTITLAASGREALALAVKIVPDLILLDVMMPDMDGFDVCRQIRAMPELVDVPVLLITALDDDESRLQGFEAGANDFVSKPINRVELRARVKTLTQLTRFRRLQTQALKTERDRTQAIFEALGEAVVVTDTQGHIEYANPAAVTLTGYSPEELSGKNWRLFIAPEQAPTQPVDDFLTAIEASARQGETWHGEVICRRKNNVSFEALLTVAALPDPITTNLVGLVIVYRDITPLKETHRAKDIFVSTVSHELRTPLSVLMLLVDNLVTLYSGLDDTDRTKMIHDVQKYIYVLDDLVSDILTVAHLDSRRMSMDWEPLNLTELVVDEIEKLMPLAVKRTQTLTVTGHGTVMVHGHETQLRRVIRNLLNNAIKYTHTGGDISAEYAHLSLFGSKSTPEDWPELAALPPGNWAALKVVDNGPGIEAEHLPRLFERFYRVVPQVNVRGTGLGLAIARELVHLHCGYLTVDSVSGQGSTFAVYLPLWEE